MKTGKKIQKFAAFFCIWIYLSYGMFHPVLMVQAYGDSKEIPFATSTLRQDVVSVARSQIGYAQAKDGTVYGAWYSEMVKQKNTYTNLAWCAMFLSWCQYKSGVEKKILPSFSLCADGVVKSKNLGIWKEKGTYTPKEGDIIFFYDQVQKRCYHVGLVQSVKDKRVYTIEGNSGKEHMVKEVSYALTDKRIYGYAAPDYESAVYEIPLRTLSLQPNMMRGQDVKWLQYQLTKLGYTTSVDGYFGKDTKQKVMEFQKQNLLEPDGVVKTVTLDLLINLRNNQIQGSDDEVMEDVLLDKGNDPVVQSLKGCNHKYTSVKIKSTCIQEGYTIHRCTICSKSVIDSYTDLGKHKESQWIVDKNATKTSHGKKHKECMICHKILKEEIINTKE